MFKSKNKHGRRRLSGKTWGRLSKRSARGTVGAPKSRKSRKSRKGSGKRKSGKSRKGGGKRRKGGGGGGPLALTTSKGRELALKRFGASAGIGWLDRQQLLSKLPQPVNPMGLGKEISLAGAAIAAGMLLKPGRKVRAVLAFAAEAAIARAGDKFGAQVSQLDGAGEKLRKMLGVQESLPTKGIEAIEGKPRGQLVQRLEL